MTDTTDTTNDTTETEDTPFFAALSTLSANASLAEVVEFVGEDAAGLLPVGVLAVMGGKASRDQGYSYLAEIVTMEIESNPGCSLGDLVLSTGIPAENLTKVLDFCLKEEKIERRGNKRAAVYFLAGDAPSEEDIQMAILSVMEGAERKMSRPEIIGAVADKSCPEHLVSSGLKKMVEASRVFFEGQARGRVYGIVDFDYPEPDPKPETEKTAKPAKVVKLPPPSPETRAAQVNSTEGTASPVT